MDLPEDVKKRLSEGVCLICCENVVACMSRDIPRSLNVPIDLEIDREGGEVVLRHIIRDDPENPLTVEYSINKKFVETVSEKGGEVVVYFLDENFKEEISMRIKIDKEDLKLIRREIGLGS
ncbi:hypothetical protein [Stygiolobus caldivivus]|uniref:Uncharacterized protein n=1 Tax=Stygiolobus caldivivus TaxID=2824673 RepID=A0A8D5U514_9CREN|nr:hypothetical protein [Stygiolobus caldivivus]BCU69387.1 hypothetical protein KN1_06840 [Stygiolobus caldivivus]